MWSTGVKGSEVAVEMETDLDRMRRARHPDRCFDYVTRMSSKLSGQNMAGRMGLWRKKDKFGTC